MTRMDTPQQHPRRMAHPINEAAELLAVDRRTVYRMLARGELRAVRVGARQRIPADELARLTRPDEVAA